MTSTEIIIFAILVLLLGITLYKYTKEGDINMFTGDVPSPWKLSKMYDTKDKIIDRLRNLVIYKYGFVRWNKLFVVSLFTAFIIVYYFRRKIFVPELILVTVIIFTVLDYPYRWSTTHIGRPLDFEATTLAGIATKL